MYNMRMKYKTILFDLDGTISNTSSGIIFCLKATFEKFGVDWSLYDLYEFIGPPLTTTCQMIAGEDYSPAEVLEYFRDLYKDHVYDNVLYDGMKELLSFLKQSGFAIGVATSKYQPMAFKVLEKLGVLPFFDFVYGALPDRGEKDEILSAIFEDDLAQKKTTVLVGDTVYDMRGAQKVGIDAVAVTYGFGKLRDLQQYSPVAICKDTAQLKDFFKN